MGPFVKFVKKTVCLTILAAMLFGLAAGSTSARFGRTVKAAEDGAIMTEMFQTSSAYDIGIDPENVRLGWRIVTGRRGVYQSEYRCVVSGEDGSSAWDSGWVKSSAQTGIVPKDLKPETIYRAKVNIKDQNGTESGFGKELVFETAPLTLDGAWISTDRLLRHVFKLDQPLKNVERARCYLASTGVIEIRLNGGKVGDLIWSPRKTVYDKIAYYNTYDITGMLKDGDNCIGAYVSGSTFLNRDLKGMLRITYKDGQVQTVSTGEGWKSYANSEIVKENLSKGEDIDMRKKTDWDMPDFKENSSWKQAETMSFQASGGELKIPDNSGTFKTYESFSGDYTIEATLTVNKSIGAIMFGVKDGVSSPLMWQVGTSGLRLHHVGWTEIDTPSAKGLGPNKKVQLRIEIQGTTITTYVGGEKVHSLKVPAGQTDGALGIRSALSEVATFDRIAVIQNGSVIWEDDFDIADTEKWNFPGDIKTVPSPSGTKVIREIKPVSSSELKQTDKGEKVYVLDFGVNMQGYVRLYAKGNAGDKYKLEYAEMLDEKGDIWANTTAHKPVSNYTLSGGDDVFEPRFFYTGFRYIRVTLPAGKELDPNEFTACFTSDDVPQTGFFESSNQRLDQVFSMYNVSQRSNMMGNYTDCPQREKNGWMGDAAVTKESAALLLGDWTTAEAYLDAMLMGVRENGRPEIIVGIPSTNESGAQYDITWASAIFIFPYELYMQTGDRYYIDHSIDTLIKVFDFARTYEKSYLVPHNVYGDWVGFDNGAGIVDRTFLSTSCYYNCGMLLSKMLEIAGRDHTELDEYLAKVYEAVQKRFHKSDYYATESQTCNAMALDFGLVPEADRAAVLNKLISISVDKGRVLGTGVLGTKSIYDALSAANNHKLLLDMTIAHEKCSFGFMIDNGATSLWEYWDTPGNNFNSHAGDFLAYFDSLNHVMLGGGPACWMFQGLGGIRETGAGFSGITYRPGVESGLSFVNSSVNTLRGKCVSDWKYEGGKLTWHIEVPSNSTATVVIPLSDVKGIAESGKNIFEKSTEDVKYIGRGDNGEYIYSVGGGSYEFIAGGEPFVDNGDNSGDNDSRTGGNKSLMVALGIAGGVALAAVLAATAVVIATKRKNK